MSINLDQLIFYTKPKLSELLERDRYSKYKDGSIYLSAYDKALGIINKILDEPQSDELYNIKNK